MSIFPEDFLSRDDRIPVYKKIWTGKDPFQIYLTLANSTDGSFLLESGSGPEQTSRYSFIGIEPYLSFESSGSRITIRRPDGTEDRFDGDPIVSLRTLLHKTRTERDEKLPPFCGGAAGLFSYDLVRQFEKLPAPKPDSQLIPDILLLFVETVLVIDHLSPNDSMIIFTPKDWENRTRKEIYDNAVRKINHLESLLEQHRPVFCNTKAPISIQSEISKSDYMVMVEQCKEYIAAGDIFQANLSQRFRISNLDPLSAYKALREINPSPFSAFFSFGNGIKIASSSPERLVKLTGRRVDTRPIAGTRPRGEGEAGDRKMADELLTNHKERAEHIMLVDLERNDIGRVCRFGSVKVDELMTIEKYSHVIHIVSNITGELNEGLDALDLLKAVFPGGTITGVPKVRCMEIINELEPFARGAYTGSAGYLSATGDADLNIIIRTFFFTEKEGYMQTGAGIVADSDPEREYYETLQKGKALLEAVVRVQSEGKEI